ncbi:MAG: RNA 2',3'-cyclic phosphodiesterase [Hahellaceae bacterium]|nr:RNA 2',3'-cyclic phosphodiesterase [Hahellaceae bacterium]MCP5213215.1 RNA 2',3'-cyclic phosphodiesterase [Hahellaceae bacterium]
MSSKSSSQKELRCFIGLQIPADVKKAMATESKAMQSDAKYADFKWVKKSNYHLTLHFLGEIPLHQVVELKEAFEKNPLIAQPLQLEITGITGFPDVKSPKFIVAELANNDALNNLQQEIKNELDRQGINQESESFRPHISLARLKRGHQAPTLGKLAEMTLTFSIDEYAVFKSTLTPEGSVYEVIGSFGKPKPTLSDYFGEEESEDDTDKKD